MRMQRGVSKGAQLLQPCKRQGGSRGNTIIRRGAERVTSSKDDVIVSPSILSANFSELGEQVREPELGHLSRFVHVQPCHRTAARKP